MSTDPFATVPGQPYPLWRVAKESGRSESELIALCDAHRIEGQEWREVPTNPAGGVWWTPIPPVVLNEAPTDAIAGMLPAWVVAKRDGFNLVTLARLCRTGKVSGARKVSGCWFIPSHWRGTPRKRGGRPEILDLPQWLAPTNG